MYYFSFSAAQLKNFRTIASQLFYTITHPVLFFLYMISARRGTYKSTTTAFLQKSTSKNGRRVMY